MFVLSDQDSEKRGSKFFLDVDRYRKVYAGTQRPRGRLSKVLGRLTGALGSMQGLLLMMSPVAIIFGAVVLIVYALFLGPLVFLGLVTVGLVGITLVVERSGSRERFGSSDFGRRTLAQILGFSLAVGFVFLLLFLGKVLLPNLGF